MKRNVNFILFGLLVVSLMSIVGLTLYFQSTYESLKVSYSNAIWDVEDTSRVLNETMHNVTLKEVELREKERILIDYTNELNLSQSREESLGVHFTELRGEKDELKDRLNQTMSDRDRWMENYAKTKKELDVLKIDYNLLESDVEEKSKEISRLYGVKNNLQIGLGDLNEERNEIGDKVDELDDIVERINLKVEFIGNTTIKGELKDEIDNLKTDLSRVDDILNDLTETIEEIKSSVDGM